MIANWKCNKCGVEQKTVTKNWLIRLPSTPCNCDPPSLTYSLVNWDGAKGVDASL